MNFDPDNNFSVDIRLTGNFSIENEIAYFRKVVLPGNERVIYCSFHIFETLDCIKYDIISNIYNFFNSFPTDIFATEFLCNIEYVEESEELLIFFFGYYGLNYPIGTK